MMTIDEHIEFWVNSAEKDLESASNMYRAEIYDWCLFVGHLALEKLLKAIWIKTNKNQFPPKIHNLLKLAQNTDIQLSEEQKEYLRIVNQFNLEARYQEYKKSFHNLATKEFASNHFDKIKSLYLWLKSQIK